MTNFDQRKQTVDTQFNIGSIGVSFEQYKADLAEKEKEYRELLISATLSEKEKNDYRTQFAAVERQRLDEQASYESHVKDLKERIARLDELSGQLPDKIIKEAKQALASGDNIQADQLFTQVEEQADPHIAAAAEAAYQRGKLAEDAINYNQAFLHYLRATQLVPSNTYYLNMVGLISERDPWRVRQGD